MYEVSKIYPTLTRVRSADGEIERTSYAPLASIQYDRLIGEITMSNCWGQFKLGAIHCSDTSNFKLKFEKFLEKRVRFIAADFVLETCELAFFNYKEIHRE